MADELVKYLCHFSVITSFKMNYGEEFSKANNILTVKKLKNQSGGGGFKISAAVRWRISGFYYSRGSWQLFCSYNYVDQESNICVALELFDKLQEILNLIVVVSAVLNQQRRLSLFHQFWYVEREKKNDATTTIIQTYVQFLNFGNTTTGKSYI